MTFDDFRRLPVGTEVVVVRELGVTSTVRLPAGAIMTIVSPVAHGSRFSFCVVRDREGHLLYVEAADVEVLP